MELISQRRSSEQFAKIRQFNELLLELSDRLKSVNPFELDGEINRGLHLVGEFFDFNWNTICKFSNDKNIYKDVQSDLSLKALRDTAFYMNDDVHSDMDLPVKSDNDLKIGQYFASLRREQILTEKMLAELHYFTKIMVNALERKRNSEWNKKYTRFERFLSLISSAYNNMPADEIESSIRKDIGRLAKLLGAERCILYLFDEDIYNFKMIKSFSWYEEDIISAIDQNKWTKGDNNISSGLQFLFKKWIKGESARCIDLKKLPKEALRLKEFFHKLNIKSFLSMPLSVAGSIAGGLLVSSIDEQRRWPEDLISRIRPIAEVYANALIRKQLEERFRNALLEIKQLREHNYGNHIYLKKEIKFEHNISKIVGESICFKHVLHLAKQVAGTNAAVLLLGETGTGKGIIARTIHNFSLRCNKPLIEVNCASLTPSLIESELFGHEKGAFTGAHAKRVGCFERAHGSTLFLDEIGELSLELQAKLLRVLQDGEFERVGGSETLKADARIIVATNKDLEKEIEDGRFRLDLWYRLNIFPIYMPPLKERPEDIPLFLDLFIEKYSRLAGKYFEKIQQKTVTALQNYSWPGNIRELENLVARSVITSSYGDLQIEIPEDRIKHSDKIYSLKELERAHILDVLKKTVWRIEGPYGAAKHLGLKPSTLRMRMKKLDIRRPCARTS